MVHLKKQFLAWSHYAEITPGLVDNSYATSNTYSELFGG